MKINTDFSTETVESTETEKSIGFGFDKNADEIIFTMFTKNIYSNPIGSVVREITSNCFDSHQEANVDDAVVLRLTKENHQHYISFIDVGVGMSPERIETVYSLYFKTTKELDPNQIGGFGIGGKTPLAYTDSFYLITNFNGKKYFYCIYKGKKSPIIDLLSTEDTIERNGTTVKVPIKVNDVWSFEREITRQLYYFENLVFEGFSEDITNEYVIYSGKNFLYRGNDYNNRMHICLGRVAYPIDFSTLGLDEREHNMPVALKFEIGELNVGASRENLEYNDNTKKAIKAKIAAAKKEITEMLLAQHKNINSIKDFYQCRESFGHVIIDAEKGISFYVGSMVSKDKLVYPKYKVLPRIPSSSTLVDAIINYRNVGSNTKGKKRYNECWNGDILKMNKWNNLYFIPQGTKRNRRVQSYMKSSHSFYTSITPVKMTEEKIHAIINEVFKKDENMNSVVFTEEMVREAKMLINEVMDLIKAQSKDYTAIVVPEDYVIPKRNVMNEALLDHEIPVRYIGNYIERSRTLLRSIQEYKGMMVYGFRDDEYILKNYYDTLFQLNIGNAKKRKGYRHSEHEKRIRFIVISKGNEGYLKHFKNVLHHSEFIDRFVKKKTEKIKDILVSHKFNDRFQGLNELFFNKAIKTVDPKLKLITKKLERQKDKIKNDLSKSISINLSLIGIDRDTLKSGFEAEFAYIEKQMEKNKMLDFINIPDSRWDDATKNPELMKLINLVYVK